MPNVKGRVSDVLNDNIVDEFCLVRSKRIEPTSDGIKIDYTRQIPVVAGYVSFVCQPGAAVLIFVDSQRRPTRTIPLMVPDNDVTLADAYAAGKIIEEEEPQIIERLVQDALTGQAEAKAAAVQAGESAAKAAASEESAADSASEALSHKEAAEESAEQSKTSAEKASESEGKAANSVRVVENVRDSANNMLTSIRTEIDNNSRINDDIKSTAQEVSDNAEKAQESADLAETYKTDAKTSADSARTAATKAGTSASNASKNEKASRDYATRAETARDTAVSSASSAGESASTAYTSASDAKESLDEIRTIKVDIDDKVEQTRVNVESSDHNATRAENAAKEASSYAGGEIDESRLSHDIVVKLDSIEGKADKDHDHYMRDIKELASVKNPRSEVGTDYPWLNDYLLKTDEDGWINIFNDPWEEYHPTRKSYVDNLNKRNTVCGYVRVETGKKEFYPFPVGGPWNDKFGFPNWSSESNAIGGLVDINEEGFYLISVNFRTTGGNTSNKMKIGALMNMKRDNSKAIVAESPEFTGGSGSCGGYVYVSGEGANLSVIMKAGYDIEGYFDIALTKVV